MTICFLPTPRGVITPTHTLPFTMLMPVCSEMLSGGLVASVSFILMPLDSNQNGRVTCRDHAESSPSPAEESARTLNL